MRARNYPFNTKSWSVSLEPTVWEFTTSQYSCTHAIGAHCLCFHVLAGLWSTPSRASLRTPYTPRPSGCAPRNQIEMLSIMSRAKGLLGLVPPLSPLLCVRRNFHCAACTWTGRAWFTSCHHERRLFKEIPACYYSNYRMHVQNVCQ